MNVSKRHMVPAGKVDRILLRYSFMSLDFESVKDKLIYIIGDKSEVRYDDLNQMLVKNF